MKTPLELSIPWDGRILSGPIQPVILEVSSLPVPVRGTGGLGAWAGKDVMCCMTLLALSVDDSRFLAISLSSLS